MTMAEHEHEWAFNAADSEWFCTDYECHAVIEGMNGHFAATLAGGCIDVGDLPPIVLNVSPWEIFRALEVLRDDRGVISNLFADALERAAPEHMRRLATAGRETGARPREAADDDALRLSIYRKIASECEWLDLRPSFADGTTPLVLDGSASLTAEEADIFDRDSS